MRGLPIPSLLNASGLNPFRARVRVPLRLGAVTTIGAETSAGEVGLRRGAIATVWRAVEALYRTGLHPAISLVVRRRGEVVLNRAIGHRLLGGDELMTPDTPACLFSCSKAITAVVLHKLALDDKVATYLPEFAANGKQDVTLRALLTHRAGLAKLPFDDPDPMLLFKIDTMLEALRGAVVRCRAAGLSRGDLGLHPRRRGRASVRSAAARAARRVAASTRLRRHRHLRRVTRAARRGGTELLDRPPAAAAAHRVDDQAARPRTTRHRAGDEHSDRDVPGATRSWSLCQRGGRLADLSDAARWWQLERQADTAAPPLPKPCARPARW